MDSRTLQAPVADTAPDFADTASASNPVGGHENGDPGQERGHVCVVREQFAAMIGKPYRVGATGPAEYDCAGAVLAALRTMGVDGASLHSSGWKHLGSAPTSARKRGDVLLTDSPDGRQGVAVLVSVDPREFLTATPDRGVCVIPARALAGSTVAAYRWARSKVEE